MPRSSHSSRTRVTDPRATDPRDPADGAATSGLPPERELDLLRRIVGLSTRHRDARDPSKVLRAALRTSQEFFDAPKGCVAVVGAPGDDAEIEFSVPRDEAWDRGLLAAFVRGEKPRIPSSLMLARIRRRGRMWGAIAVDGGGNDFRWADRRALSALAGAATDLVERLDQERIREVRARIDRKVMEQIRPKDLFYQILQGLRSLTDYDHSASLLICNEDMDTLEIVAEQIAWRKGKSRNVGRKIVLDEAMRRGLELGVVFGFDRSGDSWRAWDDAASVPMAVCLDDTRAEDEPPEAAMLCAPLTSRNGVLGVLKIAAARPSAFGPHEADLVTRFLPQAAIALQHAARAESLERKMLEAERKHAMADLARGVSHDLNNALGAVLPLVEELQEDADDGRLDMAVAARDLREIHRSLLVCRRIFGGMLAFARGAARHTAEVSMAAEVECTRAVLEDGLKRRRITVAVDVPDDLPPVRAVPADIEQLLLNLMTNARDAMEPGDRLDIRARRDGDDVQVVIEDTGRGIPPENLNKVQQPFFSTKRSGGGLGLAICRSIVSQIRGGLELESTPGRGTRVTLTLPTVPRADH